MIVTFQIWWDTCPPCPVSAILVVNNMLSWSSWNDGSNLHFFVCFFRSKGLKNSVSHILHNWDFSFTWTELSWSFIDFSSAKSLPHFSQRKFFSSWTLLLCRVNNAFRVKYLLHSSQWNSSCWLATSFLFSSSKLCPW